MGGVWELVFGGWFVAEFVTGRQARWKKREVDVAARRRLITVATQTLGAC